MRTFLAICITLGSWLGAGSAALAHSALLNCFDNADGTFTASLPAAGGVQNCTIRFQGQLSFSSREMEQIVNLPLAVASGSLAQIGQFADLEAFP